MVELVRGERGAASEDDDCFSCPLSSDDAEPIEGPLLGASEDFFSVGLAGFVSVGPSGPTDEPMMRTACAACICRAIEGVIQITAGYE